MPSEHLTFMIETLRETVNLSGDIAADRAVMGDAGAVPDGVPHERVTVAGRDSLWIGTPDGADEAAMLYLHGGGYVMGGMGSHGAFAARLAEACRTRLLFIDYRLAPEHPHPAALDDAVAGWNWIVSEAGIDPARTIVAGDSAGGGLTVATLLALRDAGETPAAGVALSPWTDLTCSGGTYESVGDADPLVSHPQLSEYARAYAGDKDLDSPLMSPLFADLRGLPPLLVQVGGLEVLLDDSRNLAAALEAADGSVSLQIWDDAPHVFQMLGGPEADDAVAAIAAFTARHLR